MKSRIVLFDIDGTLFDASSFLSDFYRNLTDVFDLSKENIDEIQKIYSQNREENDYFLPSSFQSKIIDKFPKVQEDKLQKILWNVDLFEKNVYKDTSVIKDLSNLAVIGIFSKGDKNFQKQKIFFLNKLLNDNNIYIFSNKTDRIKEVFEKYKDYIIYLVDNEGEVLFKAKSLFPNISAVLIDRKNQFQNDKNLIKIKDLNELKSLIYD